ncbi:hypothetical protein JCM11251_005853 [Rhodosporidiobolus azoricus]
MEVEPAPDLRISTAAGEEAGAGVVGSPAAAPPPRLPSISALLNDISPSDPAQDPSSAPTTSLPPCGSFDKLPRPSNSNYFPIALSPISHSPDTPSSHTQPSPSEFSPVATASPRTAEEAGKADSLRNKPLDNPVLPTRQLASVEFPDGNALHPLPSGLLGGRNSLTGSLDSAQRPRSNTISHPAVYELPPFARPAHGYQSFATSSERGGGSHDERGSVSRAFDSVDPFFRHPSLGASSSRPRALSISTTDEYRAWLADAPPHLRQHYVGGAPPRGTADIATLRRGSAPAPRLAFVMEQPGGPSPPSVDAGGARAHANAHVQARGLTYPPPPPFPPQQHHHRWTGHPPPPLAPGQQPPSGMHSALLPPPPPSHTHTPAGLGLFPLSIPSGLPLTSPASPPTVSPLTATSTSAPAIIGAGWGALPGRPGPPPSGQLAAELAYGAVDARMDAAQAQAGGADAGTSEAGRYICPHCTKRFARPSSLRIHMHSHTGEKPFSCHLCDRAFSVQSNLRRHLKIHKGGQPASSASSSSSAPSGQNGSRRGERIAREQQARAAAASAASASGVVGGVVGAVEEEEEDGEGEGEGEGEDEEMASPSDDGQLAGVGAGG